MSVNNTAVNIRLSTPSLLGSWPLDQHTLWRKVAAIVAFVALTILTAGIYPIVLFLLNFRNRVTSGLYTPLPPPEQVLNRALAPALPAPAAITATNFLAILQRFHHHFFPTHPDKAALQRNLAAAWSSYDPPEQARVAAFVNRLFCPSACDSTADARRNGPIAQQKYADLLVRCLIGSRDSIEFKAAFMARVEEAIASCGDRTAVFVNDLHILHLMYFGGANGSCTPVELMALFVAAYRMEQVDMAVSRILTSRHSNADVVEEQLAARHELSEPLGLLLFTTDTLYGSHALTDSDLVQISEAVLGVTCTTETQLTIIAAAPSWQERIQREFPDDFARLATDPQYQIPDPYTAAQDCQFLQNVAEVVNRRNREITRIVREVTLRQYGASLPL